jgi:Asp-tRNA(Asn)/Glu-tRNA(Gln) amidotransferase B subunit
VSTLNLDAGAGDAKLRWDVPVKIQTERSTRVELTNLNAIDAHGDSVAAEKHGSSKN